mmetsp:Transcript_35612/g.95561  ORF Transcript_35612/g.95561 Transcript_35612/m.95561 type:complete len:91 (+) Transcript_35612:742-1014(+)
MGWWPDRALGSQDGEMMRSPWWWAETLRSIHSIAQPLAHLCKISSKCTMKPSFTASTICGPAREDPEQAAMPSRQTPIGPPSACVAVSFP